MKSFFTFFALIVTLALIGAVVYSVGYARQDVQTVFEQKIISAIKDVQPSIVTITATKTDGSSQSASGVIVTPDGGLISSGHIVSVDSRYTARLHGGDNVEISLLPAGDSERDLAYFRILSPDRREYAFAHIIDSQALIQVGQQILVFGSTSGEETVLRGMISGLDASLPSVSGQQLTRLIKLDTAMESGMSGGPTVLLNGQIIGINTAYAGGNIGRGWATPVTKQDLAVFER